MNNHYKKILIITDNVYIAVKCKEIFIDQKADFDFGISSFSSKNTFDNELSEDVFQIDLKNKSDIEKIVKNYDLIFSMHCKQFFPPSLVNNIKCINVHPGFNPYNRGWYPQVFSIIYDLPIGATIHEIDEKLDNGLIIDRVQVHKNTWDTSLDLYERVVKAEIELLKINLPKILEGKYPVVKPEFSGKTYLKKDFKKLLKIDLEEKNSYKHMINRLRALSHGDYNNCFYIDPDTGKKIFVKIELTPEK